MWELSSTILRGWRGKRCCSTSLGSCIVGSIIIGGWWLDLTPSPVPLAGASVLVAVPCVAVAAVGVSPSFPGDFDVNAAPAEAVRCEP